MAESSPNGPLVDCRLPGAIAQLAERFHGMEEVEGSIPSSSTRRRRSATCSVSAFGEVLVFNP